MDERQEPSIFGDNSKPDNDKPDKAANDPGAAARRRRKSGGSSSGAMMVTNSILAIAVVVLGLGGWFVVEQRMQLMESTESLTNANRRLALLEERLRSTDEVVQASESETNEQINFWEDEIRKLWDVSNKRNRDWIEENRTAIERYKGSVNTALGEITGLKSAVSRNETALEQQEEIIRRLNALNESFNQLLAAHEALVQRIDPLADVVATFDSRLQENEEAIAAIDSFRAKINREILELQQQRGSAPFPNAPGG